MFNGIVETPKIGVGFSTFGIIYYKYKNKFF